MLDLKQEWILKIYGQESCIGGFWRSGAFTIKKHCLRIPLCQNQPVIEIVDSAVYSTLKNYAWVLQFSQKPTPYTDSWRSYNYPLQKMLLEDLTLIFRVKKYSSWETLAQQCIHLLKILLEDSAPLLTNISTTSNMLCYLKYLHNETILQIYSGV